MLKYSEAKKFATGLKISSIKEYKSLIKINRIKYSFLPINPNTCYKQEFEGFITFLGLNKRKSSKFLTYTECREFLKDKNLNSISDFRKWIKKNGLLFKNIPTSPNVVYKNEFISWNDLLNNNNLSGEQIKLNFLSYYDAKEFLKDKNILNAKLYKLFLKNNKKINFLPSEPEKSYKLDFISYSDYLNSSECLSRKKSRFLSYGDAKKFLKGLNLSLPKYITLIRDNNITFLPINPGKFYGDEFESYILYLGNDNINSLNLNKSYLNYKDAKIYLKGINLNTMEQYVNYITNNNIRFIPMKPNISYKDKGWISYEDYLSSKRINMSSGELIIKKYLDNLKIKYESQKKFENCKNKRTLSFDFYLSNINTCIEFDGKQHFFEIERYGGKEGLDKRKINDIIKNDYCKNNNIKLLRISYLKINEINLILDENLEVCKYYPEVVNILT